MSSKLQPLGPSVRVGVLQKVPRVRFMANQVLDVFAADGRTWLGEISAGKQCTAVVVESVPAKVAYRVRLGVFEHQDQAVALLEDESLSSWHGKVKSAGRPMLVDGEPISDNREYWALTGEFTTEQDATVLWESLKGKYPEALVLKDVLVPPKGRVQIVDPNSGVVLFESDLKVRVAPRDYEKTRIAIYDVIVGIEFHWEHKETQAFRGLYDFVVDNAGTLTAVNELTLEEYLYSVNSSEMLSICPEELLKAQTICARNTLLATVARHHVDDAFDICADDHCQCYRGSTREAPSSVKTANQTRGEVLVFDGKVCDTRYSKICGGIMEPAGNVWWEGDIPYLAAGKDAAPDQARNISYISTEEQARAWIDSSPDVFCNTQVENLPEELHYARKYFRWHVEYERMELEELIKERAGVDVGSILDLVPVQRGESGRIMWLDVVGTDGTKRIGKELGIRRALSTSHLYSSAFYVEKEMGADGLPSKFRLHGAGWGHGAGLCQIGAAVMAHRGHGYKQILAHYFAGTSLTSLYGIASEDAPDRDLLIAPHAGLKDLLCWEVLNCYDAKDCPVALQGLGARCWEQPGTRCQAEARAKSQEPLNVCRQCSFYKMKQEN